MSEDHGNIKTTQEDKLHRISVLLVDHALALLEQAEPGSLNGHTMNQLIRLLDQAGIRPTDVDRMAEREQQPKRGVSSAVGGAVGGTPERFDPTPVKAAGPIKPMLISPYTKRPYTPEELEERANEIVDADGHDQELGFSDGPFKTRAEWLREGVDVDHYNRQFTGE